jgi:hypothetical protein
MKNVTQEQRLDLLERIIDEQTKQIEAIKTYLLNIEELRQMEGEKRIRIKNEIQKIL